jgi:PKD repeat protein
MWDFGDGNTTNSTVQYPVHTYNSAGNYTVNLTASNGAGSESLIRTSYITVTSGAVAPVAGFTGTPLSGAAPLTVQFNDTSSNSPTSWNWSFGDGNYSTDKNPSYTYNSAGTYTVRLTATNSAGSGMATETGYITVSSGGSGIPVANFTGTPTTGPASLDVTFTDT